MYLRLRSSSGNSDEAQDTVSDLFQAAAGVKNDVTGFHFPASKEEEKHVVISDQQITAIYRIKDDIVKARFM